MQEIIEEVNWDLIRVSPFQPRRVFSEEEIEELAASIKSIGLIHPPVVRKIQSGGKLHYYELIAGERRWRACQKAGLLSLKVLVRDSSDEHAAKATLIENIQRVDLNPIEMAQAFRSLIEVFNMTQEEVAERVGKKRSTVANYLRLLSLPKSIQEGVLSNTITMGHAKAILSLTQEEMQKKLHEMIIEHQMTVREAEKHSLSLSKSKKEKKITTTSILLKDIEKRLEEAIGTKVEIDNNVKNKGKIVLHYYNLDDLDRLLEILETKIKS